MTLTLRSPIKRFTPIVDEKPRREAGEQTKKKINLLLGRRLGLVVGGGVVMGGPVNRKLANEKLHSLNAISYWG